MLTEEDRQLGLRILDVYVRECATETALGNERLADWWAKSAFDMRDTLEELEREDA